MCLFSTYNIHIDIVYEIAGRKYANVPTGDFEQKLVKKNCVLQNCGCFRCRAESFEQIGFMFYHIVCRMLDFDDHGHVRSGKQHYGIASMLVYVET